MANYNEINSSNSPNYTAGRGGNKISAITIHWWGDPAQNPSAEGVVNWLCNPAAQVSAHLVVTGTGRRVWQLVNDQDTAWHAGNWTGNQTTIGIECDPRCRDEDYDTIAEVIADLWRYYGKLPLRGHNSWVATRCPGNYDLNRLQALAEQKLAGVVKPKVSAAEIQQAYRDILGREADNGGLNTYLNSGFDITRVRSELMASQERKVYEQRLATEAAAKAAEAAQKAADEAKKKEKERLEAEAKAAAEKAQQEADKLNTITQEQMNDAIATGKETNNIVKLIWEAIKKIFNIK